MKACNGRSAEIIVVNNSPEDGSSASLQAQFPSVQFIDNRENTGFARANNLALGFARGEAILFLNPDTILPEQIFVSTLDKLRRDEHCGAMGVRMLDGQGYFLPESKRGFPGTFRAFAKMSGLYRLSPFSKFFGGYYLSHLDPKANHAVEVLSGAFMLVKKSVLSQTGGFDEQFFMYAEDIDLSYRISRSGYTNFYIGTESILHFKGESSGKDRAYQDRFYGAMQQFVRKYRGNSASAVLLIAAINFWKKMARLKRPEKSMGQAEIGAELQYVGDDKSIEEARKILDRATLSGATSASITVLCEGASFSYQQLIRYMEEHAGGQFLIHGGGTRSVVGSFDPRMQGWSREI